MFKNLITANKIKYTLPNDSILFDDVTFAIKEKQRIGLIGKNGSGKTTLLKIINGFLKPTAGDLGINAQTYYLPQFDLQKYHSNQVLYEYISEHYEEWWKVFEMLKEYFFIDLDPEKQLKVLSGGEIMKVNLSIGIAKNPDVFLLDEPTNHLDLSSLKKLIEVIQKLPKSFVIVSHDPYFLDKIINSIWEIEDSKLNVYGGNYSDYKLQKRNTLDAKQRAFESAKKELKKMKRSVLLEEKRAAASRQTGKLMRKRNDRSIGGMSKDYFKNRSEKAAGKNKQLLNEKITNIQKKLTDNKLIVKKKSYLSLKNDKKSRELLVDIKDASLQLPNKSTLVNEINLTIYRGDRIAILGDNGSGKTSLIKNLQHNYQGGIKLNKEIFVKKDARIVFVDQKYDIVNPEETLLNNVIDFNPGIILETARKSLGNMLFINDEDIKKKASVLSGGELARLCFAMITCSSLDLLILDEPTNNLDIETIEVITESLKKFSGSIVVISHNVKFLEEIGVENCFNISGESLQSISLSKFITYA
jgi:ATPase subunit of ABC transporter with duplicated ATPase domains